MKYTKEILAAAVRDAVSVAGVLRSLGMAESGGLHNHITKKIQEFQLDVSHFLGRRANSGKSYKGPTKLDWREHLRPREAGVRQKSYILRRALLESGRAYQCAVVGCPINNGEWLSKPIMLQVNHLDGNWLDDRAENLEFLCPNCHSQTTNYCGSKGLVELTSGAKHQRMYRVRKAAKREQANV